MTPCFAVSLGKFAVLSLFSFGVYPVYWFYEHWRSERARTGEDLWVVPRAVFSVLFAYSLFKRIQAQGVSRQVPHLEGAGVLAIAFFLINGAWRLPDPYWMLSLLAFLPLLPAQAAANRINRQVAPDAPKNDAYTGANVTLIVLGAIFLLLVIIGLTVPEETVEPVHQTHVFS